MFIGYATPEEICSVYGLTAWVAEDNDGLIAMGGFRRAQDRVWGYLDVFRKRQPLTIIRAMKRAIHDVGEDVYVSADTDHPNAHKLLTILGFAPIDETVGGMRVWKCRA